MRRTQILNVAVAVAMLVMVGNLLWLLVEWRAHKAAGGTEVTGASVPVSADPIGLGPNVLLGEMGNADAQVALVVFSDFQCPYCGDFARDILPQLEDAYGRNSRVIFAFRHLPLTNVHAWARQAAEVAECGREQSGFRRVHDLLFNERAWMATGEFGDITATLGLDGGRVSECLQIRAGTRIDEDIAVAMRLGITGTPAFVVGRVVADERVEPVSLTIGATASQLASIIEAALRE